MQAPALDISNLRFRYPGSDPASGWIVNVASLQLDPGEQLLLRGGSGVGKSTLLHLVAGLIDPDEGVVRIAGTPIHSLRGPRRDHFRGRHIGMIFQTFNLLHGFSAIENVMMAMKFSDIPKAEHRTRAGDLLVRLGIERQHALPEALSVGQQQRVAVARAVACRPALVLADEPTASLDPDNADAAVELIKQTCREHDAALLCVSHDPAISSHFTRCCTFAELAGRAA